MPEFSFLGDLSLYEPFNTNTTPLKVLTEKLWFYLCICLQGMGRSLPRIPVEGSYGGDHLSVSRTLCGALVFPSVANLVGRLLFRRVTSNLQRTILVSQSLKKPLKQHYQVKSMMPNRLVFV